MNRRAVRNVGGSVAVAAGVLALSLGLPAIDRALPVQNPVDPTRRIPIGDGVTVLPPPDTFLDASGTAPRGGKVTLNVGGLSYVLREERFTGSLDDLADRTRTEVTDQGGIQSMGDRRPTESDQGVPGWRTGYATTDGFGWFEVYVDAGTGVTVQVEGNDRSIAANADAVDASITTLRFPAHR